MGYVLFRKSSCTPEYRHCNCLDLPLSDSCTGWNGVIAAPEDHQACLKIRTDNGFSIWHIKNNIHAAFSGGTYLFGQAPYGGNLVLFTKLPKLHIWLDEGLTAQDVRVRIRQRQTGDTCCLELGHLFSGDKLLPLDDIPLNTDYGVYSIRVYEGKSLRKTLLFAYVPAVSYTFNQLLPWPEKNSNHHKSGFEFQKTQFPVVTLADNVNQAAFLKGNEEWISAFLDIPITEIHGSITFRAGEEQLTLPWCKRVRNFTWSIWYEGELDTSSCHETYMATDTELAENKLWLSLWIDENMLTDVPLLKLVCSGNAEKQVLPVRLNHSGHFTVPYSAFEDTLNESTLPADLKIEFNSIDGPHEVYLVHISEAVILPGIGYSQNASGTKFALFWDKNGNTPKSEVTLKGITEPDFQETVSLLSPTEHPSGQKWIHYLPFAMKPGLYKLEQAIDDDFFFDSPGYTPPKLQQENILSVNMKMLQQEAQSKVSSFLKLCIYQARTPSKLKSLQQYLQKNCGKYKYDINESVFKLMVAIIVNYADGEDEASESMLGIITILNDLFIDNQMRTQFIKWITTYHLSSAQKKNCFRILNLYLAEKNDSVRFTSADIDSINYINSEFGLMWMLRTGMCRNLYMKLNSVVGFDALKNMIQFSGCGSWEGKLADFLEKSSPVPEINLNRNLIGRTRQFHDMFIWGSGNELPHLDLEKRPDSGIYFCGQTYCDILINWYLSKRKLGLFERNFREEFLLSYLEMDKLSDWMLHSGNNWLHDLARAAESRRVSSSKEGFFPLFYYSLIGAAVHIAQENDLIPVTCCIKTEVFLKKMLYIFPELLKRDLLICQLLHYFDRRN